MPNPKSPGPSDTPAPKPSPTETAVTADERQNLECQLAEECWKFKRRERTTEPTPEEFPEMHAGIFDSIVRLVHIQFEQSVKNRLVRSNKSTLPAPEQTETLPGLEGPTATAPGPDRSFVRVAPGFIGLGFPGSGDDSLSNSPVPNPDPTATNPKKK